MVNLVEKYYENLQCYDKIEEDYSFSPSNDLSIKSTLNKTKLKMKVLNTYFSLGLSLN